MNPVLRRRMATAAGLFMVRIATRALADLAPEDARWITVAVEAILFLGETWIRTGTFPLRRFAAREEEGRRR